MTTFKDYETALYNRNMNDPYSTAWNQYNAQVQEIERELILAGNVKMAHTIEADVYELYDMLTNNDFANRQVAAEAIQAIKKSIQIFELGFESKTITNIKQALNL
jgi:hypothetical protein